MFLTVSDIQWIGLTLEDVDEENCKALTDKFLLEIG